jgi:hypothetical protein
VVSSWRRSKLSHGALRSNSFLDTQSVSAVALGNRWLGKQSCRHEGDCLGQTTPPIPCQARSPAPHSTRTNRAEGRDVGCWPPTRVRDDLLPDTFSQCFSQHLFHCRLDRRACQERRDVDRIFRAPRCRVHGRSLILREAQGHIHANTSLYRYVCGSQAFMGT